MYTNITYNTENADEKFREILRENDPRTFYSINEPDSITQNIESLLIIDEVSDQTLWKDMINKSFRLLSSTITKFEITNSHRFSYSEVLNTLLDIKKKTQINIHKQTIEISMLCVLLKVLTTLKNNDDTQLNGGNPAKNILSNLINEYTDYITNFPT